jgi:DNA methylase
MLNTDVIEYTKYRHDIEVRKAQVHWSASCTNSECTLHQLSPYIGKLKSSIAEDLINEYTKKNDIVLDPFSGSGTIPLEALIKQRKVIAADASIYSKVLTLGKLTAPENEETPQRVLTNYTKLSANFPDVDMRNVPKWVRSFFHNKTLNETIKFIEYCKKTRNYFLLACSLGILHHQRPGFLSYPSSHLVPYLRNKKYPKELFPDLYQYRELLPRLESKIARAYKRPAKFNKNYFYKFHKAKVENLIFPKKLDALITSPPYMNMLDYNRDNRLRLWFLNNNIHDKVINENTANSLDFNNIISSLAKKTNENLKYGRYSILVIGDKISKSNELPSEKACELFERYSPKLKLKTIINDSIPDIRRSRKECKGVKSESILVFQKTKK